MKSRYTGIDICRLAFACLIPLLHISLPDSLPLYIVRQYVSRLGVPFFFAVSGMFLSKAIADRGNLAAMKKQLWRIGVMLCIWFCIYAPLFSRGRYSINEYLFLTPGYLWYLSAMLFAVIPFCSIKNKSAKHGIAMILYIVGTLFGGSYQWLSGGGIGWYAGIFLSTRNGLFFAFPLMCVGEMAGKAKASMHKLLITTILLFAEITFVGTHVSSDADRSMYFFLPLFTLYFVSAVKEWNPKIDKVDLAGYSSAIYLMQYGLIWAGSKVLGVLHLTDSYWNWAVYILVMIAPVVFYCLIEKRKAARILF